MKITIGKDTGIQQVLRDNIEKIQTLKEDLIFELIEDKYTIDTAIALNYTDIRNFDHAIIFKGNGNTKISGGIKIENFKKCDNSDMFFADVDVQKFRNLYVNGKRATRARSKEKFVGTDSYIGEFSHRDGIIVSDERIKFYKNPQDVELVWEDGVWRFFRHKVEKIIPYQDGRKVILMKQPYYSYGTEMSGDESTLFKPGCYNPFYIENALELLTERGEWYHDISDKKLYYYPNEDEDMSNCEVIIPQTEKLVEIIGAKKDSKVSNIKFIGIEFEHTSWLKASNEGFATIQGDWLNNASTRQEEREGETVDGGIILDFVENISFIDCEFKHMGASAIKMINGVKNVVIENCEFFDISDSAIQIGLTRHQVITNDVDEICSDILIKNNIIHNIGVEYFSALGICAFYPARLVIKNNEIYDVPYSGISLGWGWSTKVCNTVVIDNVIENNIIHDYLKKLKDGGAIYTLGEQKNTRITGNYIYNQRNFHGAVYTDNGSTNITINNNVFNDVYNWLFIWEPTITNIKAFNNYTDSFVTTVDGTNCENNGNYIFDKNYPSVEAVAIINNAGVFKRKLSGIDKQVEYDSYYSVDKESGFEKNGVLLKYQKEQKFSKIFVDVFHDGVGSDFEIYISNDLEEWDLIGKRKALETGFAVILEENCKCKYIYVQNVTKKNTFIGAVLTRNIMVR